MFIRSKRILIALIIVMCLGSLTSLMLAGGSRAQGSHQGTTDLSKPPSPYVDPSVMRVYRANVSEIPVILVLHTTISSSLLPEDQKVRDLPSYRHILVNDMIIDYQNAKASIMPLLDEARLSGDLSDRKDLWIVNGMALTASPDLFRQLLASEAVDRIYLDHSRQYIYPKNDADVRISIPKSVENYYVWGLENIRAPQVWNTFGFSGTGSVVAVMDTGVDFIHPALSSNYRGNLGKGLYDHSTSWFDAINAGLYPYDDQGHGSHVAGTAVGAENIGVAPGADWIGVKVLDTNGYGLDSWILSGFQWLLAPDGDPLLAPDIVNASWSSMNPANTVFEHVIQTLTDAGIFVVFSAGNEGPLIGSIGSPASYPGVFAVGATDKDDEVAAFSGRGPSPWGEIKPYIVAPGVDILSSMPGGVYKSGDGTSMATPHVVGLAAILRGVSHTLSVSGLANIITNTARPLSVTVPNNESGWGAIDAFEAVVRLVNPAVIHGNIKDINGQIIASSSVSAESYSEPILKAVAEADKDGVYTLALNPGIYNLQAKAFGHYNQNKYGVEATGEAPVIVDFILSPKPIGVINGRVYISGTEELVTESLTIGLAGTPLTTSLSLTGSFAITAPEGTHILAVDDIGYRSVAISTTVQGGMIITQDIHLTPSPKLLLVDEGLWYYGSQITYWTQALDALRYTYDVVSIKIPQRDTPVAEELMAYDIVLWSSPRGAPGLVGGAEVLATYLEGGGKLLISGQEVAYFDGGGEWDFVPQNYLRNMMGIEFIGERSIQTLVHGQGPFADLSLQIYGGDGADNQISPDIVQIQNPDNAAITWVYDDGEGAGSAVEICTQYRALFFGFGYEAIAGNTNRQKVMQRSLDWLISEPLSKGLTINHISHPIQVGSAGTPVTHTLRLSHIGINGNSEFITMTTYGSNWNHTILPKNVEISPCSSVTVNVVITIPQESRIHETDLLTLTAVSSRESPTASIVLKTKTPAPVLVVDDDRWYPVEDRYFDALEDAGIFFDIWDNQDSLGGNPGIRSPQTETLNLYPVIIWFTGYDWYDPVSNIETERLLDYLEHGGHLILSSQDFFYHHESDALVDRLGVQAGSEAQDIMSVQGTLHPSSGDWDSVHLNYPFPAHTDIIEPAPTATVSLRGGNGQPLGVAAKHSESSEPATLFYGVPLESIPSSVLSEVLSKGIGWLSPLGESEWYVRPKSAVAGDRLTYELILHNNDVKTINASAEHNIPAGQLLYVPSFPADLTYDANNRRIKWEGQLHPGQVLTYVWESRILFDQDESRNPTVTFFIDEWGLNFDRFAPFYGTSPDLDGSRWLSEANTNLQSRSVVTLSFLLQNSSNFAGDIQASVWMMEGLSPITASSRMTELLHGWSIPLWTGYLDARDIHTLTLPIFAWIREGPVRVDALLYDDRESHWEFPLWLNVLPRSFYLPLITR